MDSRSCVDAETMAAILGVGRSTLNFFVSEGLIDPVDPEAKRNRLYRIGPCARRYLIYKLIMQIDKRTPDREKLFTIKEDATAGEKLEIARRYLTYMLDLITSGYEVKGDTIHARQRDEAFMALSRAEMIEEELDEFMGRTETVEEAVKEAAETVAYSHSHFMDDYFTDDYYHQRRMESARARREYLLEALE